MIAITFALPAESSGLVPRLAGKSSVVEDGLKIISGKIGGQEIEILHTGVGRKVSGAHLTRYLAIRKPAFLISSGFAGATQSSARVGDLVLAQNFSDAVLLALVQRSPGGESLHAGRIFSAPNMIDSAAGRAEIGQRHQAIAIDMETETLAEVCRRQAVPMLSIRVVSDTPQHPFPLPADVLFDIDRQRIPSGKLIRHLLTHPGSLPRLVRFSRQIERARQSLTEALLKIAQVNVG